MGCVCAPLRPVPSDLSSVGISLALRACRTVSLYASTFVVVLSAEALIPPCVEGGVSERPDFPGDRFTLGLRRSINDYLRGGFTGSERV